jgi:hypothetical protein
VSKAKKAEPQAQALARKKWESSGLTEEHAQRLCLEPLDGPEVAALADNFTATPAVRIPYFDFNGEPTEFYRIRYLAKPEGFGGLVAKPQRYAQPAGSLNEVYLPPLLDKTWKEIAKDEKVQIFITEGEFKAAAACSRGIPCIGLGGVDVWRASKRGIDLLPQLREIEWSGRSVVVVFDSDAATNPNVTAAQRRLAGALTERGARPLIVALPVGDDGKKQGLDDFLLWGGDIAPLVADATPWAEADALWGMNEEVLYIRDPGLVVVQKDGQKISHNAFEKHAYAHRHYTEITQGRNGVTVKKRPLAPRWTAWPGRFELSRITYAPGKEQVFDDQYNMWRGLGVEPKKGDISPWLWLMGFIFKADDAAREWFQRWAAYPFQHLGAKMNTAVVLWGTAQGTGKTLIGYTLAKLYGRQNWIEIKNKDLKGGFNGWAENRQLVIGDEITGGEARIDADYLKGLITQDSMLVNVKYVPSFTIPDCINYIFTSNQPDALFLEDFDRRFFVHEVLGSPAERSFYETYDRWYRSVEGQAALLHHLLELDLGNFNPRAEAPETEAKKGMIRDSKSDLGNWVLMLKEDPERALSPLGPEAAKGELFTATQLLHCYDPEKRTRVTVGGLGKEMKRSGFRQANYASPVYTSTMGLQRIWAIKNGVYWADVAKPKQITEAFDKVFGQGGKHT